MSTFTRSELLAVVRRNKLVQQLTDDDDSRIKSSLDALFTTFTNQGLQYLERWHEFRLSGRPEHAYRSEDISRYLNEYLESVQNHKTGIRKAIALALRSHFDFLGDKNLSREERLKKYIFGG